MPQRTPRNVVHFPRSRQERARLLRESVDPRARLCGRLRKACGWLLVFCSIAFCIVNYRLLTPSSIRSMASFAAAGLRQGGGDLTSIPYENGSFRDAALFSSGLAYADSDSLYFARPGGALMMRYALPFTSPVVESSHDFVLAYERGGHGVGLYNTYAPVAELTQSSSIITGTISPNGSFAIVTDEQGYRTAVYVYDSRGNSVFQWQSSKYYIVSAALSDDGKQLAVLAFDQQSATLDTHLLLFRTDRQEVQSDQVLSGALGLQATFLSDNSVAALCDNGLYLVKSKGEPVQLLSFATSDLLSFSISEGTVAVATRSYVGGARSDVYLLRGDKLSAPLSISEEPTALALSRSGLAILTASGVSVYKTDLSPVWHNPEAVGARRVLLADDGTVYALYSKNARLFTARTTQSTAIS